MPRPGLDFAPSVALQQPKNRRLVVAFASFLVKFFMNLINSQDLSSVSQFHELLQKLGFFGKTHPAVVARTPVCQYRRHPVFHILGNQFGYVLLAKSDNFLDLFVSFAQSAQVQGLQALICLNVFDFFSSL